MKCKFGIVSIMLAGLALTATAQTKEKYYSEKFKDNIFISAGVGAQACVNPHNFDYGFGHAITPLIHVSVGKLFNPIWINILFLTVIMILHWLFLIKVIKISLGKLLIASTQVLILNSLKAD